MRDVLFGVVGTGFVTVLVVEKLSLVKNNYKKENEHKNKK